MSLKFTVIKLLCFSFLQQIFSFKKFDVADLGIFFGQAFYTSDKHLVILYRRGLWNDIKISTLNRYFAIVIYCKQHQTQVN